MKIKIHKIFKGHTSLSKQSAIWVEIETTESLEDIINLYSQLQRNSKIVVSNEYKILSGNLICICSHQIDASIKTLKAIQEIYSGEDKEKTISQLKSELSPYSELGQNNVYFLNDALELDIPYFRFSNSGYFFGTGIHTKAFSSTSTRMTSSIGLNLAKNKLQTSNILRLGGFPYSESIPVYSESEAIEAALMLGYPVVVKPQDKDNGDGVYSGIKNESDLRLFYNKSRGYSSNIIIEKHQLGFGHRITVYNNTLVSATKKLPWGITGDGKHTVSELLTTCDEEILSMIRDQNLSLSSILNHGQFIPLRRKNNASASGTTIPLDRDKVHIDNINLAFDVARLFSLDIVGIDLIIEDISKSWLETRCVICDVNAVPQIGHDRVKTIFNEAFNQSSRSPMYLLIVKTLDGLNLDKIKNVTSANGISSLEGVYINDRLISNRFDNGFDAARIMIFDNRVERGLVVMTEDGIKEFGLPLDKFNSVFLQDIKPDQALEWILLGQNIININE